jgi:hypothetical protein
VLLVWTVPNQLEIPDEGLTTGAGEAGSEAGRVQDDGAAPATGEPNPAQDPQR